jgi:hypothetical protein
MRTCARCGKALDHPEVIITFATSCDTLAVFFCSDPHALEYLEQKIIDDAKELAKK